ncbi:inorganic phosphate transporter, PiT family [Lebetimonas natsushimae]|uniref:Phosphate transporter n=1 Tax=Lebetimonas natsushimae TaxID=1936991 RepID=A0A292YFK5_9BACT|nr:inorganic phosphate transporter [Lebetimonas natsushimae]GAX87805.1 inorganic phosphate transporter, PiT family [Lebetimonas natsushimae]
MQELQTLSKIEKKIQKKSPSSIVKIGIALFFIAVAVIYAYTNTGNVPNDVYLLIAVVFGAYMAMNIGANDVANNVGPTVGSGALSLTGAIIIAAIFEASGALIAGADVTNTIRKGIIDLHTFGNVEIFIWAMMAALLAAALWLNLATYLKAPVSTTHSIVGGVMGAGIAAGGFNVVHWITMGKIAASWVISPIIGGIIAALFLYAIKKSIVFKDDKVNAAKKWVPFYISVMTWAFITYIIMKGFKHIWGDVVAFLPFPYSKKPLFWEAAVIGLIFAIISYFWLKAKLNKEEIENTRKGINKYFIVPLIFSAALLSFAHGANDVANAVGPLAAIADAVINGGISAKAEIPFWVMVIGGVGISFGLALYGPRLIKTVGKEITKIDPIRGFCIALAAAITVIIASQLGLPVSSTHIAVGAVFGVGFLREWLQIVKKEDKETENELKIAEKELKNVLNELEVLKSKENKQKEDYKRIVTLMEKEDVLNEKIKKLKKILKKEIKAKYVERNLLWKIVAAWIITVPVAGVLSAMLFFMIKGMMG